MTQQLDQIAFSVVDVQRTERWFRDAFGFVPAGGTRSFRGWGARHVQGLPGAASTCWWLVDRSEHFQIELFQFEAPLAKLMPADHRPCDVGYSRVGFWVQDFDQTLERLAALGTPPLTAPIGTAGERRVCVRNPEGVFIEVMEDDPLRGRTRDVRPDCRVAARSVTLSVPDLEKSKRFFMGALGMPESAAALRRPGARSALGAGRRHHSQRGARCGQRARRTGAVPRSRRQAMARGTPHQRPGHPQHRLRLPQDARDDGFVPSQPDRRRPAEWLSAARRQLGRRVRERRAGIQRGTAVGESALGRADGIRAAAAREAAAAGHASCRTHRKHCGADGSRLEPRHGSPRDAEVVSARYRDAWSAKGGRRRTASAPSARCAVRR